jgi:hypothetical protein
MTSWISGVYLQQLMNWLRCIDLGIVSMIRKWWLSRDPLISKQSFMYCEAANPRETIDPGNFLKPLYV